MTFPQIHVIIILESGYSNLFDLHVAIDMYIKPLCLSSIGVMVTQRSWSGAHKGSSPLLMENANYGLRMCRKEVVTAILLKSTN